MDLNSEQVTQMMELEGDKVFLVNRLASSIDNVPVQYRIGDPPIQTLFKVGEKRSMARYRAVAICTLFPLSVNEYSLGTETSIFGIEGSDEWPSSGLDMTEKQYRSRQLNAVPDGYSKANVSPTGTPNKLGEVDGTGELKSKSRK
mgnify:CR=1 FL=1